MQDIMVENQGRGFMTTHNKFLLVLALFLTVCSQDLSDDPIPFSPFPDEEISISQYPALQSDKGYITLSNIGHRGVIVYRESAIRYRAFEMNCSYQPLEACATVNVDISTLFIVDSCCNSRFDFNGNPISGPAWRPLREYQTTISSGILTITDDIVN
jgi:hypothetical protein